MAVLPSKKMKFKLYFFVFGILALMFTFLIGRIVYVACFAEYDGTKYGVKAYNQQMSSDTIYANRGTIYDRNMNPLAQSATVWTVSIAPHMIEEGENEIIASRLAEILELDYNEILEKTRKTNKYEIIKKKVEQEQADLITEFVKESSLGGRIHMVEDTKRYYLQGSLASHVIGFTGTDNQGLYGIELEYDSVLNGTNGKVAIAQNALGENMPFEYEYYYPAEDGNSLVLTIDETLQRYVDSAVEEALDTQQPLNRIAAIMMDVNTGEILAMSVDGGYDLNDPYTISDPVLQKRIEEYDGDDLEAYTKDVRETMWTNKAVSETYEPGSVFKVVTASSALEEGVVSLDSTFNCSGVVTVAGTSMKCWKSGGHGHQTFTEAVVNSCNPSFISIGQSLGVSKFNQYLEAFGMTNITGIDLPGEMKSLVISEDNMGLVELASESFGQSLSVTPIQMITAFAATINGGYLVTPHVVSQVIDNDGNLVENYTTEVKSQVISSETSEIMRQVLEAAVSANGGTTASVSGYRIAGKSGTAQKLSQAAETGETYYVSSFVGTAPADNPQYALIVMVDSPTSGEYYGSAVASPVFSSIMSKALPYLGLSPEYTDEELQNQGIAILSVQGYSIEEAKSRLTEKGLSNIEIIGSGDTIVKQVPETGSKVMSDGKIILYTTDEESRTVVVPDLTGLSQTQANQTLAGYGLNIAYSNVSIQNSKAVCKGQSPAAGETVEKGTIVTVDFLTNDETW